MATIIGISGCSSSGKTTLSRLLRDIFPHTFILHQDDFYKPEEELPLTNGLRDWDSASSLDLPSLHSALSYVSTHGTTPPWLSSKEDRNPVTDAGVPAATISRLRDKVASFLSSHCASPERDRDNDNDGDNDNDSEALITASHPLCILDGFLLYAPTIPRPIRTLLSTKLFLRASYGDSKRRREARKGYVTLEGWWEDPPGYVEAVVWPNYVRDHGFLFVGGDVERGEVDEGVVAGLGVRCAPRGAGMGEVVEWAVGVVLEELVGREKRKRVEGQEEG